MYIAQLVNAGRVLFGVNHAVTKKPPSNGKRHFGFDMSFAGLVDSTSNSIFRHTNNPVDRSDRVHAFALHFSDGRIRSFTTRLFSDVRGGARRLLRPPRFTGSIRGTQRPLSRGRFLPNGTVSVRVIDHGHRMDCRAIPVHSL